ncbi:hypothetical protein AYL20_00715 [Acinetobacter venetianus]|uniref:hypothetical protein n=1 Tax=Acinetobacter venetianus TaxID=52133 RepID=UPI000775D889|nr:hypothetical protein [Acinetobacter venetianus]KXO82549.1 hypothetical protein AYL20_00715 [Acinetobacter venetianus]
MKNKLLTTTFYSSIVLLTACGGGSDSNNNENSFQSKEKVDYTKAETIESIYEPITNLSQDQNNILLIGTEFAESLYYGIYANNNFKCSDGSYTKNSDKSITFNKCSFLDYANDDSIITQLRVITISGSVNSKETLYTDSGRYETTLKNFKITPSNNDTITYNGSIISKYSYNNAQYQIKKMTFNVFDNETKESNQLIANNYQLNVNKLTVTSQGNVEGNPDNKIFSVNFKSDIRFENINDKIAFYPNSADIVIEDMNNVKNSIKISNTSNYKALIRAYADGITVAGYPKTIEWSDLE